MKRFRFNQENLLQLKRQIRRQAEIDLWHAQSRVSQAEQRLANLHAELDQLSADWPADSNQRAKWSWCLGSGSHQRLIARVHDELQELKVARDDVRAEYERKDADYEALRRLRNERWGRYRADMVSARQHELDESALRKWLTDSQVPSKDPEHA